MALSAVRHREDGQRHVPRPSGLWRFSRGTIVAITIVAVLLVALRAALPYVVKRYVNQTLAEVPEYHGRVADIDIHLWRGAYEIVGIDIVKTGGDVPVPFFSAPAIDLSLQWRELFHGALVGEIDFRSPKLNLVTGPTEETSQTEVDGRWQDKVRELFPLRINRFEVHDGEIHYRDFHTEPRVDVMLEDLHVLATNLTNSRDLSKTLVATIEASGRPLGDAKLAMKLALDPYAPKPTFDLNGELERVDLVKLNDFLKAYGNFDVQSGTLGVYTELAASKGRFTGYVKPLIENLDIVDLDEEADSALQKVWEGVVALVGQIFRNHPRDRFATKVDFSGSFDKPSYSVVDVIFEVVKNAFVKALAPEVEGKIDLEDAEAAETGDDASSGDEGGGESGDDDPEEAEDGEAPGTLGED